MGLFIKKDIKQSRQLYTMSQQRTVLIVGLGNVGKDFVGTRHNIGFEVVDKLAKKHDAVWKERQELRCLITDFRSGDTKVILIKPTTLMNSSGEAVSAVQRFYRILPSDTLVVHDELDLQLRQLRTRVGGSSAGHNGIKSLIVHGNEETKRLRIGIGPKVHPDQDSADFVLGQFSKDQAKDIPAIIQASSTVLADYIEKQHFIEETIAS
jgi:peptidyl-tRNA hydrolase, PTH1 family